MKLLLFCLLSLYSEPTHEEYIIYSKALTSINVPYFTPPLDSKTKAAPLNSYQFFIMDKSINEVFGLNYDEKDTTNTWLFPLFLKDTSNLGRDENWLTLLKDFGNRKLQNITFKANFDTPFESDIISFDQFPKSKKPRKFWKKYYTKYPKSSGFIRLSEIIYSRENDKAVFYYERFTNPLNAVGGVVFMKKYNNDWHFVYMGQIWVS